MYGRWWRPTQNLNIEGIHQDRWKIVGTSEDNPVGKLATPAGRSLTAVSWAPARFGEFGEIQGPQKFHFNGFNGVIPLGLPMVMMKMIQWKDDAIYGYPWRNKKTYFQIKPPSPNVPCKSTCNILLTSCKKNLLLTVVMIILIRYESIMIHHDPYPLVNSHITMENHHFQWENPLFLWPFSIATLNYQRVSIIFINFTPAFQIRWVSRGAAFCSWRLVAGAPWRWPVGNRPPGVWPRASWRWDHGGHMLRWDHGGSQPDIAGWSMSFRSHGGNSRLVEQMENPSIIWDDQWGNPLTQETSTWWKWMKPGHGRCFDTGCVASDGSGLCSCAQVAALWAKRSSWW